MVVGNPEPLETPKLALLRDYKCQLRNRSPIGHNDHYVSLDTAAEGDPLQWTLTRLRTRLPAMLIQADEPDLARAFDQRDIDAALPKIAGWAEALQAQARQQG